MAFPRVVKIWCMLVFWTVYVRSKVYEMSYRCKKQDVSIKEQTKPVYSVLRNNLVSCAVTCGSRDNCLYFVYNRHNMLCHGYGEDVCDDTANIGPSGDGMYHHTCKRRCPKNRARYKLIFQTGNERNSGSKSDLMVSLHGQCGQTSTELENGKHMRLQTSLRSTVQFDAVSVCSVESIGLAFSDSCHEDGWLVSNVVVQYEELTTGDRGSVKFQTDYWLSANEERDKTTGIICFNKPATRPISPGHTECDPSQICVN